MSRLLAAAVARQLQQDVCVSASTPRVRVSVLTATRAVNAGLRAWGWAREGVQSSAPPPSPALAADRLGVATCYAQSMTGAMLMASLLSGEERVVLQLKTEESASAAWPITHLYAEASCAGEMRGFVHATAPVAPQADADGGAYAPGAWRGSGEAAALPDDGVTLAVTRVLYNHAVPHTSMVPTRGGDVAHALESFFAQSDQIDTALVIDAQPSADGSGLFDFVGGVIAQPLAQTGGADVNAYGLPRFSSWEEVKPRLTRDALRLRHVAADGVMLQHVIEQRILPEVRDAQPRIDPVKSTFYVRRPAHFHCRCSKHRFLAQTDARVLAGLTLPLSMHCDFCNAVYPLSQQDLDAGPAAAAAALQAQAQARAAADAAAPAAAAAEGDSDAGVDARPQASE